MLVLVPVTAASAAAYKDQFSLEMDIQLLTTQIYNTRTSSPPLVTHSLEMDIQL